MPPTPAATSIPGTALKAFLMKPPPSPAAAAYPGAGMSYRAAPCATGNPFAGISLTSPSAGMPRSGGGGLPPSPGGRPPPKSGLSRRMFLPGARLPNLNVKRASSVPITELNNQGYSNGNLRIIHLAKIQSTSFIKPDSAKVLFLISSSKKSSTGCTIGSRKSAVSCALGPILLSSDVIAKRVAARVARLMGPARNAFIRSITSLIATVTILEPTCAPARNIRASIPSGVLPCSR